MHRTADSAAMASGFFMTTPESLRLPGQ